MSASRWIPASLTLIVGLAAGIGVQRMLTTSTAPRRSDAAPVTLTGAPTRVTTAAALDEQALRARVGAIVRDELRAAAADRDSTPTAAATPVDAPAEPPAPTAENLAADERARARVEAGLTAHRWTDDDALALRGLVVDLTTEQRADIYSTLFPAINRDEIAMESSVGPL